MLHLTNFKKKKVKKNYLLVEAPREWMSGHILEGRKAI